MSELVKVRKVSTVIEEVYHDGGKPTSDPIKRGVIMVALENPYAGRFV